MPPLSREILLYLRRMYAIIKDCLFRGMRILTEGPLLKVRGSGTAASGNTPGEAFEGGYGYFYMQSGDSQLICQSAVYTVPKGKLGYFLELNYRNDVDLIINMYANNQELGLITLRPRDY